MDKLYRLDPECPGGWGQGTVVDNQGRIESGEDTIPVISKLHVIFNVWLGDDLLDAIEYLVTERMARAIENAGLTGGEIRDVQITANEQFLDSLELIFPGRVFPAFRWLVPLGSATYTSAGVVSEWSGDDICIGINSDYPDNLSIEFIGLVPDRYGLVVSQRALDVIEQFQLDHCEIVPMTF
jgi:hypothetical protein